MEGLLHVPAPGRHACRMLTFKVDEGNCIKISKMIVVCHCPLACVPGVQVDVEPTSTQSTTEQGRLPVSLEGQGIHSPAAVTIR